MAGATRWFVDKRIVEIRLWGILTVDDIARVAQESQRMVREGTAPVHLISDLLAVEKFPSLLEVRSVSGRETVPGTGWQVIVVTNPVLRFFGSILMQLAGTNFHFVNTRQEAFAFLNGRDVTLPVLQDTRQG
jgi:hypothetical protein